MNQKRKELLKRLKLLAMSLSISITMFTNATAMAKEKTDSEKIDDEFKTEEFAPMPVFYYPISEKPNYEEIIDEYLEEKEEERKKEIEEEKRKERILIYNEYLTTYASYYHLDSQKVIAIARYLTNDYSLDFVKFNNTNAYDTKNPEAAALIFVEQLSKDNLTIPLNKLGYSLDDLIINHNPEFINDDLILRSGLSYSEFLGKTMDLLNINPEYKSYFLAISYLESGRAKSNIARTKNNFGGMKTSQTYITPEAGIIAFCQNLQSYEWKYEINNINDLSGVYFSGDCNIPNEQWVSDVLCIRNEILSNENAYFLEENGNTLELTK